MHLSHTHINTSSIYASLFSSSHELQGIFWSSKRLFCCSLGPTFVPLLNGEAKAIPPHFHTFLVRTSAFNLESVDHSLHFSWISIIEILQDWLTKT